MRAKKRALIGVAVVVLLVLGESAGNAQTYTQTSVPAKHGTTVVSWPEPLLDVTVDPWQHVGVKIYKVQVSHTDGGAFCSKVRSVTVSAGQKAVGGVAYVVGEQSFESRGGLCNFNFDDASIGLSPMTQFHDWAAKQQEWISTCAQKVNAPASAPMWQGMVDAGYLHRDLYYNSGEGDNGNVVSVHAGLTCTTCPLLQVVHGTGAGTYGTLPDATLGQTYKALLIAGGEPPVRLEMQQWSTDTNKPWNNGMPAGLTLDAASGRLTGTPSARGQYWLRWDVTDACGPQSSLRVQHGLATLRVKDTQAPRIIAFTVTPATVSSSGDKITVDVKASDNDAIARVSLTYTKPDGTSSAMTMTQVSGNATSGEWQNSWDSGTNSTTSPQTYTVAVRVSDADGNVTTSASQTYTVSAESKSKFPRPGKGR